MTLATRFANWISRRSPRQIRRHQLLQVSSMRPTVKPRLERLENRLAMSGFGPEDGAYFIEPRSGSYEAVVIQPADQKIVAAGLGTVARYDSQGGVDASYGSSGLATVAGLQTWARNVGEPLALQADGKALTVGSAAGTSPGLEKMAVARLTATGASDASFGTAGLASADVQTPKITDTLQAVAQQSSGKVIGVGYSGTSFIVARFNAAGGLDAGKNAFGQVSGGKTAGYTLTSFGTGNVAPPGFEDVAIQPDDKIVAVGSYGTGGVLGDKDRLVVARYTGTGQLDTTFNGTGYSVLLPPGFGKAHGNAVALQPDGKIAVAGWATGVDGATDMLVARYNTNGTLDTTFGSGAGFVRLDIDGTASATLEYANDLKIQLDGKIVVTGWGQQAVAGADGDVLLARLNADGTPDTTFSANGVKVGAAPAGKRLQGNSVALQADGSIIVAGTAGPASGPAAPQPLLMRFYGDNAPAAATASGQASAAATDDALMWLLYGDSSTTSKKRSA